MLSYVLSLSLLICAVLIIRAVFRKKISQRLVYALWIIVVIKMCLPFTIFEIQLPQFAVDSFDTFEESTNFETEQYNNTTVQTPPANIQSHETDTVLDNDINAQPENNLAPETYEGSDPNDELSPPKKVSINYKMLIAIIWYIGSVLLLLWFSISFAIFTTKLWNTRVYHSKHNDIDVYVSDKIASPCVAGLKPIIYITKEASISDNLHYVLVHEYTHLHHGDRIWTIVRILSICVFWWNPLVWLAAFLSKSDAELACDESVVKKLTQKERNLYACSIIDMIPKKSNYAIGFGNGSIKERIVMLTDYKPKRIIFSFLAVIISLTCVGCAYSSYVAPNENISNTPSNSVTNDSNSENDDKSNSANAEEIKYSGEIEMTIDEFNNNLAAWTETVDIPGNNYFVNILGMKTKVRVEFRDDNYIFRIEAYGNSVDIKEWTNYEKYLFEFNDSIIFSDMDNGGIEGDETIVISEFGVDELRKDDNYDYKISVSNNNLIYTKTSSKYKFAAQDITRGLSVAEGWDDVYYYKGNADIVEGRIIFNEAYETVFAKDAFNFIDVFNEQRKHAAQNGTKYYNTIEDLFESNKKYVITNYKDICLNVSNSEQNKIHAAVINKLNEGVSSENERYSTLGKLSIEDETYYIVSCEVLFDGNLINNVIPLYIVNESLSKIYSAEIIENGKSLRYSRKYNFMNPDDNLLVTIPVSDYE